VQVARISLDTQAGPSDWFTGSVYIDTVGTPSGASRVSASSVHSAGRRHNHRPCARPVSLSKRQQD
jgi:hypothetical protein